MVLVKFIVADEVFARFPDACFGVVVARGLEIKDAARIEKMLMEAAAEVPGKFPGGLKNHSHISVWRDAFHQMGWSPSKFLSSVEALMSRVVKTGLMPKINPVVDLVNVFSMKYVLPMGAHDIGKIKGNIQLRLSRETDRFTPFGTSDPETVPAGEIVYADDAEVRTRRWVWRQGEKAKIGSESKDIFFPIDGFCGSTGGTVLAARDELSGLLREWSRQVDVFWVDKTAPVAEWQD